MKISLNTIRAFNARYHCADDVLAIGTDQLMDRIGTQLGALEGFENYGLQFDGVLLVKVVVCKPHPDADKLHVCEIDDGGVAKAVERTEQGLVRVVCGAPNVREGLTAVWLPPGVTVPETAQKEPFVLTAKELRGVVSNGMLASARELGLSDDHEGIVEVDEQMTPGTTFVKAFDLEGDVVLDLENKMFTHRPDCFGFMGVARELAGIQGMAYKSPDWYKAHPEFLKPAGSTLALTVKNEIPQLVPRFMAITMDKVKVGTSPLWLQVELAKVGIKSINNIVDYTNFFMLETGQPMHAYDYDKVKALSSSEAAIVIRQPRAGEKIKLLNGKTIEPGRTAIMIATDQQLIGVGGVMGGSETEVDQKTERIILECANFDMYSIRRTSMAHGLFTDAVTRFTKGQSPLQCPAVLARVVNEIASTGNGQVAGEVIDDMHHDNTTNGETLHAPVEVSKGFINQRLGLDLDDQGIIKLLANVEFQIQPAHGALSVQAPFWRADIELKEDVVEEVGRLYGFDKLPLDLPKRDMTPIVPNALLHLKADARSLLSAAGANEVLTYSFVHGNLLDKVGQDKSQAYQLSNALSPDLQYYRLSLTPSLLNGVNANIKGGYSHFALFEIGKTHVLGKTEDDLPKEFERIALVIAADTKAAKAYFAGPAYYEAKYYLVALLEAFGLAGQIRFETLAEDDSDAAVACYAPGRAATVYAGQERLGRLGEYRAEVRAALKLPDFCAGFELGLTPLLAACQPKAYTPLSRFPKLSQDITLALPPEVTYKEVYDALADELEKRKPEQTLLGLTPVDIYQAEDTTKRHITLRLSVGSYKRTLKDDEVQAMLRAAAAALRENIRTEQV